MTHDQQTYKRAAGAAMWGLVAQVVLALAVLLLAMWAETPAVTAVTWHIFAGIPIWIVLMMIYHQHRLERMEALETEQLASRDTSAAAIFDERAQDLHVARRRLDRLYKWGLGGVSIALALYLMIAGGIMLYANAAALRALREAKAAQIGVETPSAYQFVRDNFNSVPLIFAGAALFLVAFLVARYVAGMTRVKEWQMLRGGASYLMGAALMGALLFIGAGLHFLDLGGDAGLTVAALVVPAIMAIIGLEIAMTFVLSAYRPRRAGEMPRPAFDSRLLGWTTSPESLGRIISETINYQFGFEISRSWFYRLLSRAMTPLIILGMLSLMLVSSVVVVEPHERAIITRFGEIVPSGPDGALAAGPGLHLKLPWPIGGVEKFDVDRVHQVIAGSSREGVKEEAKAILWTQEHLVNEEYLITAPTPRAQPATAAGNTTTEGRDLGVALLAAEVAVQYQIGDVDAYVKAVDTDAQMREVLTLLADRCVSEYFVTHHVDELLTGGREEAGEQLRANIQRRADELNLGIKVKFVGLAGVHPPQKDEVAASFHKQISAFQEAQSAINEAEKKSVQSLTEAAGSPETARKIYDAIRAKQKLAENGADAEAIEAADLEIRKLLESVSQGEVARLMYEARSYRREKELAVQAQGRSFLAAKAAYDQAPLYYTQRAYFETLAEQMKESRLFIVDVNQLDAPVYQFNFKETSTFGGGLFEENQ